MTWVELTVGFLAILVVTIVCLTATCLLLRLVAGLVEQISKGVDQ